MPIVFSQTLQQQGIHREATLTSTWQVKHRDRSLESYFLFFVGKGLFLNTYLKIKRVSEINILQTRGLNFEAPKSWRSLHREAHQNRKARQSCSMSIHLLACWAHGASFVECRCQNGVRYVWEVLCVLQNKGLPTKEVWTLHQSTNLAVLSQGPSGDTQVLNLYAISYFSWMELNKRQDSQSSQGNGILSTLDSSWTLKVYALLCIIWGLLKSVAPLETLCCFTWIACHNAGRLQGILNQSYYS